MKRLLIIIILLFLPVSAFAEIHGFFEVGKTLENEWTKAEIELQWWMGQGNFRNELYGGWQTWFVLGGFNNYPFKDIYFFGDRIHFRNWYFEVERFCNHPVYSRYNRDWWSENLSKQGYLTTFSIGIKW